MIQLDQSLLAASLMLFHLIVLSLGTDLIVNLLSGLHLIASQYSPDWEI